jgi:hypothetical protein
MLSYKELNALMLEVVVHDTLVVPSDSNTPLFKLTYNTLASLLGYSRNIALSACVLETQVISISYKNIPDCVENWP